MTILEQIKERIAYQLSYWEDEPSAIHMSISAGMVSSDGKVIERAEVPLVRCRDCEHEFEEWGYPYCCRIPTKSFETHGDNFCGFAERRDA